MNRQILTISFHLFSTIGVEIMKCIIDLKNIATENTPIKSIPKCPVSNQSKEEEKYKIETQKKLIKVIN